MKPGFEYPDALRQPEVKALLLLGTTIFGLIGALYAGASLLVCTGITLVCIAATYRVAQGTYCPYHPSIEQVRNKTVIITGANSGIGKATSIQMAKWGARVIMACRNEGRGREAVCEAKNLSGSDKIEFALLDLSSFTSIRNFVNTWGDQPVDILINNAGVMMCPYTLTEDGVEMQFGTNHLGHFLLTNLLLPNLKKTPEARVVSVASIAHGMAPAQKIPWNTIAFEKESEYHPGASYGISKLANIHTTTELQRRLEAEGCGNVTAYSVHPGAVFTNLSRHYPAVVRWMLTPLMKLVMKTMEAGAQTSLYCAVHPDARPGQYYADCTLGSVTAAARDSKDAAELWDASVKLVHL